MFSMDNLKISKEWLFIQDKHCVLWVRSESGSRKTFVAAIAGHSQHGGEIPRVRQNFQPGCLTPSYPNRGNMFRLHWN